MVDANDKWIGLGQILNDRALTRVAQGVWDLV